MDFINFAVLLDYFASKPPFAFLVCMAHEAGRLVPVAGTNF